MTIWLVDASVVIASEDDDDANQADAQALLDGPNALATIDLALYEVANVAVRAWTTPERADQLVAIVQAIGADRGLVRADSELIAGAIDIAARHEISVYDAAYVAAARRIGARLVSCDARDLVGNDLAVLPADVD